MDRREDCAEWDRLAAQQPETPDRSDPQMVADLPEPARRYFTYAVDPGTPLLPVAVIEVTGECGTEDYFSFFHADVTAIRIQGSQP